MNRRLDPETVEVYQTSLTFIPWLESILRGVPKSFDVADPLDRANSSQQLHDGNFANRTE